MTGMKTAAVVYCRVSSDEQVRGTSLETQEATCRQWCDRNGLKVARVFTDRGESAKTADRPAFQEMARWCAKNRADLRAAVVYKLDRFARCSYDHHVFRGLLAGYGIQLRSATEPMTDDPAGELLESMLSAIAQFDNQVRAERTRTAMRSLALRGYYVFRAPVGYRTGRTSDNLPTLEIDPEAGSAVRQAFDDIAMGRRHVSGAAAWLVERGAFDCSGGTAISRAHFMFRNPAYCALIRGAITGHVEVKGRWPALVDRDTWDKVQAVLAGRRIAHVPYHRAREEFPLRGFVRCECGRTLTASRSTGRHARYAYYHCVGGCGAVRVAAGDLHDAWCELLDQMTIGHRGIMQALREMVAHACAKKRAASASVLMAAQARIVKLEKMQETLLDRLLDGTLDSDAYKRRKDTLDVDLATARVEAKDAELRDMDAEAVVNMAISMLGRLRDLWHGFTLEQRQRFQRALFPRGITYRRHEGFGTAVSASVFGALLAVQHRNSKVAPLIADAWNRIIDLRPLYEFGRDLHLPCAG